MHSCKFPFLFAFFNHFYNEYRVLSEQSVWRAMCLRGESAKHYQNYGELLYTEGLRMKEKKARRCEQQQRDNEARELAQMTATPEIR